LARHWLNKSLRSLPDSRFIGTPVPGYEIYRIVPTFAVEYITFLSSASWKLARNTHSMSVREGSPQRKRENGGGPDFIKEVVRYVVESSRDHARRRIE